MSGRARMRSIARVALALFLAHTLAACDSGTKVEIQQPAPSPGSTAPPPPPVPQSPPPLPRPPAAQLHGHFRGGAEIGNSVYYVDAVVAVEGDVRMHIAGPFDLETVFSGGGFPVSARIAESMQLVGRVELIGDQNRGEGVVLGQTCAPSNPGRFCSMPAPANINLAKYVPINPSYEGASGEVRVTTDHGEEVWLLDLYSWSIYYHADPYFSPSGPYRGPRGNFWEWVAEFAEAEDTLVTVDAAGRLFFQSHASGCVGNGTLTRRSAYYVFDVDLVIASCKTSYASFNGVFEGLATESQSSAWDYDETLLMFLSAPEGSAPRPAISMIGGAVYCSEESWWAGTCY